MATLINGDGNVAVYAAQDADWYAGIEGDVTKILPIGLKMAYEIEDANTIAVKNGVIVTKEGRRIQIDAGSIDEFIIPTGSQGIIRYFIIGYHLYTDSSSNQLCETFVQLMTSESETITENTFRGGATDVYVSLYRVKQDGLNLDTITALLPEGVSLEGIGDVVDQKLGNTDISGIGDGTVTGAISTVNSDLTELSQPSITITGESSDTYATLLNKVFARIDSTKMTWKSVIRINGEVYQYAKKYATKYAFTSIIVNHQVTPSFEGYTVVLASTGSQWLYAGGSTKSDYSSTSASGTIVELVY